MGITSSTPNVSASAIMARGRHRRRGLLRPAVLGRDHVGDACLAEQLGERERAALAGGTERRVVGLIGLLRVADHEDGLLGEDARTRARGEHQERGAAARAREPRDREHGGHY